MCNLRRRRAPAIIAAAVLSALATPPAALAQPRTLGVDVSYWNSVASQANWNTAFSTGNRKFAFIRASRGGTTGLDQGQGTPGGGSTSTLSRRYDDPNFVQNINRATTAGMYAGPYHYGRPDITTNTGTDEANHFIEMAGAWMRPGYMMPVFDLEGAINRTASETVQFTVDFSNRIYAAMGIRPGIYVGGSYSDFLQGASLSLRNQLAQPAAKSPSVVGPAFPMLWNPRYAFQGDDANPGIQTDNPKDTASTFYGPWDDYGTAHPWSFWQYSSTSSIPGLNAVDSGVDSNVSHGDIEYVRNYLVPAVWWNDSSGDWSTLANWNSGQTPTAPATGAGQATPLATGPLPTPRLPGASGSGSTSGQYDTVILERPNSNITVTLSTGTHNVRKLYMRETLNITGGTLTINYDPTYRANDSATVLHGGPISAQFSGPVTLSGSGALNVHTLQVDSAQTFTLAGGTLAFNTINLISNAATKIAVTGDVNLNPLNNASAVIKRSASSGTVDLGGGTRTLTIGNGAQEIDLDIQIPIINNGGLTKSGLGTLRLSSTNTYTGATNVNQGVLNLTGSIHAGSAVNIATAGAVSGTGTIGGNATITGNGVIQFSGAGNIGGTLAATGGNWLGAGSANGLVTVSAGNFNIGSGANLSGNSGVQVTGGTIVAADASSTLTNSLTYASATPGVWAGNLAGSGKTLTLNNGASLTLTGANTYTGLTTINHGTLILSASNNINNTSVVTTQLGATGGTVRLSNNISIGQTLAIGGAGLNGALSAGLGNIGALDNQSGVNTWAGNITLNGAGTDTPHDTLNTIGASAGTLVLNGIIQNGAGNSWSKTGSGDVVLTGASANTYSNATYVQGGRLIIEKNAALGAAGSSFSGTGNTFMTPSASATIAFRSATSLNYSTFEWLNLQGNGAPGFAQLDNLSGANTFAGNIGLAGPANVSTVGVTAGSLHITGGIWTHGTIGGPRTLNKLGAGALILSGNSNGASPNILNGVISGGAVNVTAGILEMRSPNATTTNMPGMSTWNVANGATLRVGSGLLAAQDISVAAGGLLELPAGGGSKTLRAATVTPNGKIDIADHKMIVDYTLVSPIGAWNGTAYEGLTKNILDGRNGGAWDGNGIVTSMSDAQGANNLKATIGIAEASRALGLLPGETGVWRGQSVDATTVLIAYAYQGDADLSGSIDADDFFHIDAGYQAGASGFGRGDFNYDGRINADDYFLINSNYGRQYSEAPIAGGAPAGVSSVPEPAALGFGIIAATLLARRRRQVHR